MSSLVSFDHPVLVVASSLATSSLDGEGWRQIGELMLALLLSSMIGLEREVRQKSAGLRTHTLVGVGAALFMLISKYGFTDVLQAGRIVLDPSRVAAQIVTGVGFLGAGLIFVRRDSVRGLTTAASIWLTAAVGACAGAGLPILASVTTVIYFVVAIGFSEISKRLPRSSTAVSVVRVRYLDGRGILRLLLQAATGAGFTIDEVLTESLGGQQERRDRGARFQSSSEEAKLPQSDMRAGGDRRGAEGGQGLVQVTLEVHGKSSVNQLAAVLSEIDGVDSVVADDVNVVSD
jgi:putative Mg2+ transporter-C (MgtC) family protein